MQPRSQDAFKHRSAPNQQRSQSQTNNEMQAEQQEDQWAILRHEVEGKEMQQYEERNAANWNQRDTDGGFFPVPYEDMTEEPGPTADIVVAGVGGGGMNAISRMIHTRVRGVRFVAMNTDAQVLALSEASNRICLGHHYTKGLGAGGNSAVGMRAATESSAEIRDALGEADLVFIAAGMGGGTGTGAAPVVAAVAKKLGALTVGIVTLPFTFEGTRRRRVAEQGISDLAKEVDALIIVPNDRLLTTVGRDAILSEAFKLADDVLRQGVQGIAEVINVPGMINVDFADVRSTLREAGTALMSIGQGQGRNRAQMAADQAIAGGFLNVTIRGAKRVLFNISGGTDMTLFEVNEVAERIGEAIDSVADITFGAVVDPTLSDTIRVTLIAAGMDESTTARLPAVRPEQVRQQGQQQRTGGMPLPRVGQMPSSTPQVRNLASSQQSLPRQQPQLQPRIETPPPVPPRKQRSLKDLRGIRGLANYRWGGNKNQGDEDDEEIDVPPFLKHHE